MSMAANQPSNVLDQPVLIYHNIIVTKSNDKYEEHNHHNHDEKRQAGNGFEAAMSLSITIKTDLA